MWTVPLKFVDSSSKQNSILLYIFEQCMILDTDVVYCDNCRVAGRRNSERLNYKLWKTLTNAESLF